MPDDLHRNAHLTVDRTRAPVSEPRGTPVQPATAAEHFLRAWARQTGAMLPGVGSAGARRATRQRVVVVSGLLVLALASLVAGVFYLLRENISDNVKRVPDVFGGVDLSTRPAAGHSLTFLLVATDSRSTEPGTGAGAAVEPRSDLLMIARLNADRTAAAVASIPRDSWVEIPGHGWDRVEAAYSLGGPSLLIKAVENLTSIRIDHFGVIDFAGIRPMVDAVGGIDVEIDASTSHDGIRFHRGVNHLDGREALAYVRQRYGLVGGDLERALRQQIALRALVTRVAEQGTLSSPAGAYDLLQAASESMSVDDTLDNGDLQNLASTVHDLEATDITFVRAPIATVGSGNTQPVVHLDSARAAELWTALLNDRVSAYAGAHPSEILRPVTQ